MGVFIYSSRCPGDLDNGPMIHINIGGEKHTKAFSIEAAYWNITHFIYSVDADVEIEKGKLRLYSEGQTGLGVTGVSFGPVVEFQFPGIKNQGWITGIMLDQLHLGRRL